ncbi:MAG TPA: bifunctional phosphoribosylaminoimidazolecarboxamide formyltransferase/inosine monophosphate cyclohydrolase [Gammaproteobacteria bacterium]|nr:bifunctional phosphoribosylaminoimidazolecarboxamide formyltransferase/inosine monophosphate cyclohydrolase [Gammaproteobacteria bacterium]
MDTVVVKSALISVSDKTGLEDLLAALAARGVALISTGGTYAFIRAAGYEVTEISEYTGSPEMMQGRVKTLHPKVHGGLLGRAGIDNTVMAEQAITEIDLLVVNLYPFEAVTEAADCSLETAIENIDIGGPAMIRSGAKNFDRVTVLTSPADYAGLIQTLDDNTGAVPRQVRFDCARKAFARIAQYDAVISNYLAARETESDHHHPSLFPSVLSQQWVKVQDMRYGENPHQHAAYYREDPVQAGSLSDAVQIQGKDLSFNNLADADAALECVRSFSSPTCVIVKHANPCGVASGQDFFEAYDKAFATDPTSAFGGIIAINGCVDERLAQNMIDRQFVEVLVADAVTPAAAAILATKKNVRVLTVGGANSGQVGFDLKRVSGGLLVQTRDSLLYEPEHLQCVSKRQPTAQEQIDLMFAWKVAKNVKSNAIVYAKHEQTIGVGAGQMSRVYSAKIAGIKAADENLVVPGSVMASDAFFPFRDGLDAAAAAGITAVIQPGGSVRDEEVIQAADDAGMAMLFTGVRHFKH